MSRKTVSPAPSRVPAPQPVNTFAKPAFRHTPSASTVSPNPKLKEYGEYVEGGYHLYAFHCPGCSHDHAFAVAAASGLKDKTHPVWTFNGSLSRPTFKPSLLCNGDSPESRCHSFVTDGRIQFLTDSWHKLAGQTVDVPDWEE